MNVHRSATFLRGPDCFLPIRRFETGCIVRHLEPGAVAIGVDPTHHSVALEPAAHIPAALLGSPAHFATVKPTVHEHMSVTACDWLKLFNLLHRQIDLALKGH